MVKRERVFLCGRRSIPEYRAENADREVETW